MRPDAAGVAAVRPAARAWARAVAVSDRWLDQGTPSDSALLAEIRDQLVVSYTGLHQAKASPS